MISRLFVACMLAVACIEVAGAAPAWAQDGPQARAQSQAPALGVSPAAGAPSAADVARDMRANGLSVGLYPGFFTPISVYRNGLAVDVGIFGGNAEEYFDGHAVVQQHLRDFRNQKIAGVSLWSTGMAALITDLVLVCATANDRSIVHDNETLYWSLLGGGVVTSIVGAIVLNSANYSLQSAIGAHNANLLNQYLPPAERAQLGRP